MDFRPLSTEERQSLRNALRNSGAGCCAIRTDPRDTSYAGTSDDVPDGEVIDAIQSVPTHY